MPYKNGSASNVVLLECSFFALEIFEPLADMTTVDILDNRNPSKGGARSMCKSWMLLTTRSALWIIPVALMLALRQCANLSSPRWLMLRFRCPKP